MRKFFAQRWFLILLVVVLAVGIAGWKQLAPLADARWFRDGVVAAVLFLMALPLPAETMWKSLRRPAAPLLGLAMNLGLLPLFAWGVSFALRADMAAGLLVAATTPCTLASAAVWTRRAGGNDAAAVLITLLTNGLCFLVMPLWLTWMLGTRSQAADLTVQKMIAKLAVQVVLPMAAAQLVRLYRPIGRWATHHGKRLTIASQCGILSMVLIGAITTGEMLAEQPLESAFSIFDWLAMLAAVLGVHLAMLACGYRLAGAMRLPREDCIAVGIAGSQKTLMIGLQVALDCGLLILPMVTWHVGQLLVDTLVADRWRRAGEQSPDNARPPVGADGQADVHPSQ